MRKLKLGTVIHSLKQRKFLMPMETASLCLQGQVFGYWF